MKHAASQYRPRVGHVRNVKDHCPVTSAVSRDNLFSRLIPYRNRVYRTRVAGADELFAIHFLRINKNGDSFVIQSKSLTGFRNAITEADTQLAIDVHPQAGCGALFFVGHRAESVFGGGDLVGRRHRRA